MWRHVLVKCLLQAVPIRRRRTRLLTYMVGAIQKFLLLYSVIWLGAFSRPVGGYSWFLLSNTHHPYKISTSLGHAIKSQTNSFPRVKQSVLIYSKRVDIYKWNLFIICYDLDPLHFVMITLCMLFLYFRVIFVYIPKFHDWGTILD